MRKILSIYLSMFLMLSFSFTETSFAEEETESLAELTSEELYEEIKVMLEIEEEILNYIPELKATFDENGELVEIEYSIKGVFKDIKELDKETLIGIYSRVSSERIRLMHERLIRQLERIRHPQMPPAPPEVHTPPVVPSIPATPQTPPKTQAPPSSPRRR